MNAGRRAGSRKGSSRPPSTCPGRRSTRSRRGATRPRCRSRSRSPAFSRQPLRRCSMTNLTRTKWFLPLFCVALGFAVFVAQWIGGDARSGAISFAWLAAFGALIFFSGRSETVRGLRGDGRDERFRTMDIHATAIAGLVVIVTLIVVWLIELARGHDGSPYSQLMAVGGLAYLGAIAFIRWRG